jgi:hypothetical protein
MGRRQHAVRVGRVIGGMLLALGIVAPLYSQEGATLDVSGYPAEHQRNYKVFAEKCSRCHDLSRPLTVKYTDAGWRDLVTRMARKPGAGISRREQQQITAFLIFHAGQKRGTAPVAASGGAPAAPAALVTLGQASQGGVRLEVKALAAQTVVQQVDGRWTRVAAGPGENTYLAVRLFDAESGEKLPYAMVKARFKTDNGDGPEKALLPSYGAEGFHYGANVAAPSPLRVQITIEPPALARVGEGAARWMSPITLEFTVQN